MILNKLRFKTEITAPTSKSHFERLLVCALLSDKPTEILFDGAVSQDISAFSDCIRGLGALINRESNIIKVIPPESFPDFAQIDCLSSGAALRFFLPLCAVLCKGARLNFSQDLAKRPIDPLINALRENGAVITKNTQSRCIEISQGISSSDFIICGDISSQFISGLLFASAVRGGNIRVTGSTESLDYILLTVDVLQSFGVKVHHKNSIYSAEKSFPLKSLGRYEAEGDWSNSAFALVGGAIGTSPVRVSNLNLHSVQGDRKILDILNEMGAKTEIGEACVKVYPSRLKGISIDGKNIPDIVLPLCVAGACAEGTTKISNISRLKYKETHRTDSVTELLRALGGEIHCENDVLTIKGGKLHGGNVQGRNDHRTVMTAALCSLVCNGEIGVTDEKAVEKSFPLFFHQFENEGKEQP